MATPYLIGLTIEQPENTKLNNVNVTVRLESTNEFKTKTTNSSGEVAFNLGNSKDFPSGWLVGDSFSIVVLYRGFEAYVTHTIPTQEGGFKKTIVLVSVPTAPSLVIYKPQEFLDYFNVVTTETDAENGVSMKQIILIGSGVEQQIENITNQVFDDNTSDFYSQTEFMDTDKSEDIYFARKLPVNSVTTLHTTQNDEETTPDFDNNSSEWDSLTEGTDYFIDKGDEGTGRIQITNASFQPITRKNGLRLVSLQGRTSVPDDIKILALIWTGLQMSGSTFTRDKIKKISDAAIGDIASFETYKMKVLGNYRSDGTDTMNT